MIFNFQIEKRSTTTFDRQEQKTYYIKDASGNTIAEYDLNFTKKNAPNIALCIWTNAYIYGSERLGMYNPKVNMYVNEILPNTLPNHIRKNGGDKYYELTNHLGNVITTITDRRIPVHPPVEPVDPGPYAIPNPLTLCTETPVIYFKPDIASATDYYPFGWAMP